MLKKLAIASILCSTGLLTGCGGGWGGDDCCGCPWWTGINQGIDPFGGCPGFSCDPCGERVFRPLSGCHSSASNTGTVPFFDGVGPFFGGFGPGFGPGPLF